MNVLHPKDRRARDEAHRQEIRRELAAHVAERVDELMVSGVSRHEAERQAAAEFGDAAAAERAMTTMSRHRPFTSASRHPSRARVKLLETLCESQPIQTTK